MGSMPQTKPHVVCLGDPKYAGVDYITAFSKTHTFSVLPAVDRASTIALLPPLIASKGPIHAFIIRMGTPPYEPFDAELLSALTPHCKIIASASAGFNEFDVSWMSEQDITFCNSVDAVGEATADMAMFLLLATVRNTSQAEKSVRGGKWRAGGATALSPARDPTGLTLGIVGMGAIGKVYSYSLLLKRLDTDRWTVYRQKGRRLQPQNPLLQPQPSLPRRRSQIQRNILFLTAGAPLHRRHNLTKLPLKRKDHKPHLYRRVRRDEKRRLSDQYSPRRHYRRGCFQAGSSNGQGSSSRSRCAVQ
jgi:hypothetical protein